MSSTRLGGPRIDALFLKERIPIKVVTERLGHSNLAYTMATCQHVIAGMQVEAVPPANSPSRETRRS